MDASLCFLDITPCQVDVSLHVPSVGQLGLVPVGQFTSRGQFLFGLVEFPLVGQHLCQREIGPGERRIQFNRLAQFALCLIVLVAQEEFRAQRVVRGCVIRPQFYGPPGQVKGLVGAMHSAVAHRELGQGPHIVWLASQDPFPLTGRLFQLQAAQIFPGF